MRKKYDSRKVKSYRSYSIADLCRVYEQDKLHHQTIRKWIREEKIAPIVDGRKILIYGVVWKKFLCKNNNRGKKKLKFRELKCCKCRTICEPLENIIHGLRIYNSGCLEAKVICSNCGHVNRRLYKRIEHEMLQEYFLVLHDEVTLLSDSCNSPNKTHSKTCEKQPTSESTEKPLNNTIIPLNKTHLGADT